MRIRANSSRVPAVMPGALTGAGQAADSPGSGMRSAPMLWAFAVLVCILAVALDPGVAGATGFHEFQETFGSAEQPSFNKPGGLAVDRSTGDLLVLDGAVNEVQAVTVSATAGEFKLKFGGQETESLPYNLVARKVTQALDKLPALGGEPFSGYVQVSGGPGDAGGTSPYLVTFQGPLAGVNVEELVAESGSTPLSGGTGVSVATVTQAVPAAIKRFNPDGTPAPFAALGTNEIDARRGAGNGSCAEEQASCDVPTPPAEEGLTNLGTPYRTEIAVDNSGGETDGDIYVTQDEKGLVDIFSSEGRYLGQLTAAETEPEGEAFREPCGVAVDPTGTVYVSQIDNHSGEAEPHFPTIMKFVPTGNPPTDADDVANFTPLWVRAEGEARATLCSLAAGTDSTAGALFANNSSDVLQVNATTGVREDQIEAEGIRSLSVNEAGRLDAGAVNEVLEYDAGGPGGATLISATPVNGRTEGVAATAEGFYLTREEDPHVEVYGSLAITPAATTESATDLTGATATLHGTLGAEGGPDASCVFEIASAIQVQERGFEGATVLPCVPGGPVTGFTPQAVEAQAGGLAPGTPYAFRLIGRSSNGETQGPVVRFVTSGQGEYPPALPHEACPNEPFRSGPSAFLPDCRAYEQASPVDKNGGGVEGRTDYVRGSADGITFYSQGGIPGGTGSQDFPTFLATRGSSAWSTQGTLPPGSLGETASAIGYSPDLRYVVDQAATSGVGSGLFLKDTRDQSITTLVPYFPGASAFAAYYTLDAFAAGGSRIFFESPLPLTGETSSGKSNIYMWDRASGKVTLVGLLPGGTVPSQEVFGGPYDWYNEVLTNGGATHSLYVEAVHAVSSDGNRVYFTVSGTGELLLRDGLAGSSPTTRAVAESHKTNGSGPGGADPNGPKPSIFLEATPDGSRAFFMSASELTNDANTGSADQGSDLYRYEPNGGSPVLTDLTPDPGDPNGAEVQGLLGSSEDGSSIYFVANGVLATGAAPGNCDAQTKDSAPRVCNLYHYEDTSGGPKVTFVAKLSGTGGFGAGGDSFDWSPASRNPNGMAGTVAKESRVSSNGQVLLFASKLNLTGQEKVSEGCGLKREIGEIGRCTELFRYSAAGGALDCISCNPTGSAPIGPASLSTERINAPIGAGGPTKPGVLLHNLSADGSRIFFQTPDALVASDTNGAEGCPGIGAGTLNCQDVYEWEAEGTGSCHHATSNGGCVYLLSDSGEASFFADADAGGENVYIFTNAQLTPSDRDELMDIYDVKVGGGLASQYQGAPARCQSEAACKGSASPAGGGETSPGTSSFNGPSNPTYPGQHPKQCKKKKGKKVQCKRHRKKRHHKRNHHHRKKHRGTGKHKGKAGNKAGKNHGGAK